MMKKRYYSHNNDQYFEESISTAIETAIKDHHDKFPKQVVTYAGTGEKKKVSEYFSISHIFNIDNLIECITDEVYGDGGELSDDYCLRLEKQKYDELETEIKKVLETWADKHKMQPDFFVVNNVIEMKIDLEWCEEQWTIKNWDEVSALRNSRID